MKRYEQAIRVITAFFAVLLGFGLKRLLDSQDFSPPNAKWPCFVLSVLLFLRFLLGSANHMWFEFVQKDFQLSNAKPPRPGQVINDFGFLVVFALIGVAICYSSTLERFLKLNLLLTGVGLAWVIAYAAFGWTRKLLKIGKGEGVPQGKWGYWGLINLLQFSSILVVHCLIIPWNWGNVPWWLPFLGPAWDWSLLMLVIAYLLILGFDFWKQLKILETATPNT